MARAKKANNQSSGANLGFETTLWAAADKMRGHKDAADCKTGVLQIRGLTNSKKGLFYAKLT